MEALRDMHLPPGFGFHPSDAELISHYLKRKVHGHRIEYDLIPEVDIYKHEPWDLPSKCNLPIEDNKWHFFASRDRKYPTGARSNRATRAGYWKSTGKDRAIKLNKRTLGTKKTLVFHEGRPPAGKRTEWIMHEYYIDENECQAIPDMKDSFVLCRVTRRDDWGLENDNGAVNRDPRPGGPNGAATSVVTAEKQEDPAPSVVIAEKQEDASPSVVIAEKQEDAATLGICAGEPNHVGTSASAELNDVAWTDFLNNDSELQEILNTLAEDESSNYAVDTGSAGMSLIEQDEFPWENLNSLDPKIEPCQDHDLETEIDIMDYFQLGEFDINDALATDHVVSPNDPEGTGNELQLHQESYYANLSNENADNGIIIRRRSVTASAANSSLSTGKIRLQVGVNRMVTSNSETINRTMKFAGNSGQMRSFKQSDATRSSKNHSNQGNSDATRSSENLTNQGNLWGIKCGFSPSAGFKILFACVCMIGIFAAVLHGYYRSGISL